VPKIISKHCELVELCHINHSGPVFLRHSVSNQVCQNYPLSLYASLVWWLRVDKKTAGRKLKHVQCLACLHITSAICTTPTRSLEIIVGLEPLTAFIKQEAMLACYRMKVNSQ